MQLQPADHPPALPDADIPPDLQRAGAVVEKAIDYMIEQNVTSISIASALLGGALGLLARTLEDGAIVQILRNAIAAVEGGDLERSEPVPAAAPGLRPSRSSRN